MRVGAVRKTPEDRRDYDIDFGEWLPEGDSLIDVEASLDDPASTLTIDSASISGTDAKVWVSGGVDGANDEITVRVTTVQGRIKTACFRVRVKEC